MPNRLSLVIEQRIVAYSLGHPGQGRTRISSELARPKRAASSSRPTACGACCRRHGSIDQTKRLSADRGLLKHPSNQPTHCR